MYIRRKVYSVLTDDYGYERLFSTNDVLLDGYDERYYSSDENTVGRDVGTLLGAAGGAAGLGYLGYKKGGQDLTEKLEGYRKAMGENVEAARKKLADLRSTHEAEDALKKAVDDYIAGQEGNFTKVKGGKAVRKINEVKASGVGKLENALIDAGYTKNQVRDAINKKVAEVNKAAQAHKGATWAEIMDATKGASALSVKESRNKAIRELEREINNAKQPGLKHMALEELNKLPKKYRAAAVAGALGLGGLGIGAAVGKVGGSITGASIASRRRGGRD